MSEENETGLDRPTENWTRFPNCILDNLSRYKPNEFKVIAFMIRKSLGFQGKANKMFAAEYVAVKLGMSEKTARAAIDGLEASGTVNCIGRTGKSGIKMYEVKWRRPVKLTERIKVERPVKTTVDDRQNLPTVLETIPKENSEASITLTPPIYEDSRTTNKEKDKKSNPLSHEYIRLRDLMIQKDKDFAETQSLRQAATRMLKKHGFDVMASAVRGRSIINAGKNMWWIYIFTDGDAFDSAIAKDVSEASKIIDMRKRFEVPERVLGADELAGLDSMLSKI